MIKQGGMFALLRSAVCGGLLSGEEISLYSPDMLPEITLLAQKHDVIHLTAFDERVFLGTVERITVFKGASKGEKRLVFRFKDGRDVAGTI